MSTNEQSKNTDAFAARYKQLNAEQKKAVDTIEGPVLVVAGPGSGKTELLSLRVANILDKTDMYPSNILCLTFTDSASVNMRKRLEGLIGPDAYRVAIHTFHSFGTEVINQHPEFFYHGASFSSADDLLQIEVITGLLEALPHDNPLRSFHTEQGYVYVQPIKSALSALKKSGLTPDEFVHIIEHNTQNLETVSEQVHEVFDARISVKSFGAVSKLIDHLRSASQDAPAHGVSLATVLADSLEEVLKESEALGKAAPLSAWKSKHTKKSDTRILAEQYYAQHMETLAEIYAAYQDQMHARGFYDFDDMLLDAIQGIENNEVLKGELQEQYQYILIDEFQDTNDAQMRLVHALTDNPVFEGRPNIMVVGDDDQAIFKFQGAELSNILGFKDAYTDPEVVTLVKNYRSTQDVLDLSRTVITQGKQRLENVLPDIEKSLVAANDSLSVGAIHDKRFATVVHERQFVADQVNALIQGGADPSSIAVIARRHKGLQELVPLLHARSVPVNYEQQQNVFHQAHIHQLVTMCRFVASLARKDQTQADEYLPEILSYPFWDIDRSEVMQLSVHAARCSCDCELGDECLEGRLWLHHMLRSKSEGLRTVAQFFIELGAQAQSEPMEYVLNSLIGAAPHAQPESDDEEESGNKQEGYFSPFKAYYFSDETLKGDTAVYVQFLTSLQTFVAALREYKKGVRLSIDDVVEFVDLHEENGLRLLNTSPFVNSTNAVSLLSAHKAKGLEFDTVFVLSCQESIWAGRGRRGLLPFPANLPIAPSGDDRDDQLRLFFVALTRAQRNLYITSYETELSGKESLKLPFIPADQSTHESTDITGDAVVAQHAWETAFYPPFVSDEMAILKPLVENYTMSVTHLNNFLNIERGGPQAFLENNLLRFPQPKSPAGSYGTAMHAAIAQLYERLKKDGKLASVAKLVEWFERELEGQRLSDADTRYYRDKGTAALKTYYSTEKTQFDAQHEIEISFAQQGVVVGGAHLTGTIDKIVKDEERKVVHVADFKTGKAEAKWSEVSSKLISYRRQLVFYKLLIEHSRSYDAYTVDTGTLEFLEPKGDDIVTLTLGMDDSEVERLKKLVSVVYKKIIDLDFPDVSGYSPDAKGMKEFEEDLLK